MVDANIKIKKFNLNSAKKIFNKLSTFYDPEEVDIWKRIVSIEINKLFKKYEITDYKLNENSYMGIVVWCNSNTRGEIYIKFVPPMIKRFNTEISTLRLLPDEITCKMYEINYDYNYFVMEKICPGTLLEFDGNEKKYEHIFNVLDERKVIINQYVDVNYKDFKDVVKHDYKILKKKGGVTPEIEMLYNVFKEKYAKLCEGEDLYLLHGDIYKNNVIASDNSAKIIDPLGFRAPFVMEFVSVCAYDMLYSKGNYNGILNKYINFFSKYVDEETYKEALFCQLVKVFIPSNYEANDGGERARKWLKIINKLYKEVY